MCGVVSRFATEGFCLMYLSSYSSDTGTDCINNNNINNNASNDCTNTGANGTSYYFSDARSDL